MFRIANPEQLVVDTDHEGKAFVYGREVHDFHTVDYEALSTLNISATQALAKRLMEAERRIDRLEARLRNLGNLEELAAQLSALAVREE